MFNDRPIRRRQGDNRKPEVCKVLLLFKRSVPSHEHVKCGILRCFEEFAVSQPAPAQVRNCRRLMVREIPPKLMRQVFVKEYSQRGNAW